MPKSSNLSSKHDTTLNQSTWIEQLMVAVNAACHTSADSSNRIAAVCELIMRVLSANKDKDAVLFKALDDLFEQDTVAYELLADCIEYCVQSTVSADGKMNTLLAIPVLVWSSSGLPSGKIDTASIVALTAAVQKHWLTDNTEIHISHTLYTPDNLPDGFHDTYQLAHQYFSQVVNGNGATLSDARHHHPPLPSDSTEHPHDAGSHALADNRFILAVVRHMPDVSPIKLLLNEQGEPDFSRQESIWRELAHGVLAPYFIGCAYDVMPPQPYYEANRNAELAIRGFSLHAAILTLITQMEITADDLRVVIGACYDTEFEEYRISLLLKQDDTVLQGIAWPLLGREETQEELLEEILAHLKALGVHRIRVLEDNLSVEYCEDCETALFPDLEGELVHISPPDDEDNPSRYIVH
jgi:hypothetical protein